MEKHLQKITAINARIDDHILDISTARSGEFYDLFIQSQPPVRVFEKLGFSIDYRLIRSIIVYLLFLDSSLEVL